MNRRAVMMRPAARHVSKHTRYISLEPYIHSAPLKKPSVDGPRHYIDKRETYRSQSSNRNQIPAVPTGPGLKYCNHAGRTKLCEARSDIGHLRPPGSNSTDYIHLQPPEEFNRKIEKLSLTILSKI